MNPRLPFLREKTAKLTTSPGVYLMKNEQQTIIYVGKAKNLKNRVTSYFRVSADHTPKVSSMVALVYDYDFIVTDSEYEALVLECSLIKQYQPKYNILLKDDKGYHYIFISDEPFPRFSVQQNKEKKGTYLGPYMSGFVAKEAVKEVNKVFRLPTCNSAWGFVGGIFPSRHIRKSFNRRLLTSKTAVRHPCSKCNRKWKRLRNGWILNGQPFCVTG